MAVSQRTESGRWGLRCRADVRSLSFLALHLALFGVGFAFAEGWALVLAVPALCASAFVCASITHNAMHLPMWHAPGLNALTQVLLTVGYGHPVSFCVSGHIRTHHRHLQKEGDAMRTDKVRFRWNFLNQLAFAWVVSPETFRFNVRYFRDSKGRRSAWRRQVSLETVALVGFTVLAYAADPMRALLLVSIPHLYASWGIMGITYLQHDGCDADSRYDHSRNFLGRAFNFITCNGGYHTIHHMKPTLHWSLLPEAHARLVAPFIREDLDRPSMLGYAFEAFIYPGVRR